MHQFECKLEFEIGEQVYYKEETDVFTVTGIQITLDENGGVDIHYAVVSVNAKARVVTDVSELERV